MEDKKSRVLMWLEYAGDPEICEKATGLSQTDCVWVAHQLLQGPPGQGVPDDSYKWALEMDAKHVADCAVENAQFMSKHKPT